MTISHFNDLLLAARHQAQPQRLLLVFAEASLPDHATPLQREQFENGESGELTPRMCVDKDPQAVSDFDALSVEARDMGFPWVLMFAAALDGATGIPPSDTQTEAALQAMVEAIRVGDIGRLVAFDKQGVAVSLR